MRGCGGFGMRRPSNYVASACLTRYPADAAHEVGARIRPATRPPGVQVHLWTEVLEHAEHNRGDEGECNIRGYNAKSADERTYEIHWESSLGSRRARN